MKRRSLVPAALSLAVIGCSGSGSGGAPVPGPPDCSHGLETPRAFQNLALVVGGRAEDVAEHALRFVLGGLGAH